MMGYNTDSRTDTIWKCYNRLHISKLTGGLGQTEFSDLITNICDVYANAIKQGKISIENQESFESFLSQFLGKNKDNYYDFPHKGLDTAAKKGLEGNLFARDEINNSLVMGYEKTIGNKLI